MFLHELTIVFCLPPYVVAMNPLTNIRTETEEKQYL